MTVGTVNSDPRTSVTPAAEDLPLIISVDDHILEPRNLWQDSCPRTCATGALAWSARRFGSNSRAVTTASPAAPTDGQWCDLWLFDDLVVPDRACCTRRPASRTRSRTTSPPTYEDFRAGHVRTRRRALPTWTPTTSRPR